MRTYLTNPPLVMRIVIFVTLFVFSASLSWWLDTPLYELSRHLDSLGIILVPFVLALCFLVWILYDLAPIAKDYVLLRWNKGGSTEVAIQHPRI